jgi:hypothetical protein
MTSQHPLPQAPAPPRRSFLRRFTRRVLVLAATTIVLIAGIWATAALSMSNLDGAPARIWLPVLFGLIFLAVLILVRPHRRARLVAVAMVVAVAVWYFTIFPSNDRNWAPEVARLPTATVNGNLVEIKNIRNFDYRTVSDFTPRYCDKIFDLDELQSADLICVYWGSPAIAHVMTSFGFGGDDYVAFSIEMRNEKGEANSMVGSLFRNYELIYIVADERDVIRVRTNYRDPREQVHIYRTRLPIEDQRKLFLSYVAKVDELSRNPEWYNTLEDNCTTGVLKRTESYKARARYTWKVLLSGYAAEYGYDLGMLDTSMPFAELSERCLVNAKAEAASDAPDFSTRIREGIPLPKPMTMQEFLDWR